MHFGVLNYEKQHKEGTCKVSGRSVVFSAFYADFCLCPKLLIITTLNLSCVFNGASLSVKVHAIFSDVWMLSALGMLLYLNFSLLSECIHVPGKK